MRSCGLALSGTDSRCYFPATPPIFSPRRASNSQVSFLKSPRPPSACVRVKAAFINDAVVSDAVEVSFYELLGVPESGSMLEIKQAYKQMALKYHPDVSPPGRIEEYTRKFIKLQEAYETLSDPNMRALYDRDLARGLQFAFSSRKRCYDHEEMEEKSGWRNRWQDQLSGLKRRSMNRDSKANMSWGARMRRERDELHKEDA
ncbi:chaperone protein dnaJ 20 [Cucumis melo var. makuwa]|uniref:Chaperone protein dnaJ 20 n=2 Tax=Cucumis melo TaxID=3656 RepID=A0A5A7SVL1_CUCMM|nr:chaperone protein dnaJ 20 [Cucumis melo var. makuwa]TYK21560.1 chaperone protein dnaJ 20 [Cucumis melo var. makuwa]